MDPALNQEDMDFPCSATFRQIPMNQRHSRPKQIPLKPIPGEAEWGHVARQATRILRDTEYPGIPD